MQSNSTNNRNITFQSCKGEDITLNTELRHLPFWVHNRLAGLLNSNNDIWKEFASILPNLDKEEEPLLTYDNIRDLEQQWNRPGNSPGNALLKHWYHSGRKRPTVAHLLNAFIKMQFYRAADFVSQELLRGEPISLNHPLLKKTYSETNDSPSETNSLCDALKNHMISETQAVSNRNNSDTAQQIQNMPSVQQELLDKESYSEHTVSHFSQNSKQKSDAENISLHTIPHFKYSDLYSVSKQFSSVPVNEGGSKLGEGAFGEVYLGVFGNGFAAIKRLKANTKQFIVELQVLIKYKHKNLLQLLGYSSDGPAPCLIYEYMENGSLQNHLDWKHHTPKVKPIPWKARITLALGIAEGIVHLHTFRNIPLVHRDIKSSNILLDKEMIPKIADFGLARISESGLSTTKTVTHNVSGTSVYMAPEAFRGDVSEKLDTYSYGVVILELLTGLYAYDESREDADLITHLQNNCKDITDMLDEAAGKWDKVKATSLFKIASNCIEEKKKSRPLLKNIIPYLEELQN